MTTQMRTNVLKREEKGLGPISFPRLLISGFGGVAGMFAFSRIINFWWGCGAGIVLTVGIAALTQPVNGTPMAQFLVKSLRGIVSSNAVKDETNNTQPSLITRLLRNVLTIDAEEAVLNCEEVFETVYEEVDELDFVFFRDSEAEPNELQVLDNPFG